MPTTPSDLLLLHIYRKTGSPHCPSDRDLLRQFAAGQDEASFAELVQRHGAMVHRTARRLLHNVHDADDVFQAAFIILARKAAAPGWQPSVGPWLYQVAYRLARAARRVAARRRVREAGCVARPAADPLAELSVREAQAVVDAELMRLPERLRGPLVLCTLEGATRDEAARQLGVPPGTVARRLLQGRALLQARLARRGLGLSAALLTTGLTAAAAPLAAPAALVVATARAGALVARGLSAAGLVSTQAVALAGALARVTVLARWMSAAALLVLLAGTVAAIGLAVEDTPVAPNGQAAPPAPLAALPLQQPKDKAGAVPSVKVTAGPVIDCTTLAPTKDGKQGVYGWQVQLVHFSPDGKAVFIHTEYDGRVWNTATGTPISPPIRTGFGPQTVAFCAKGKSLLCAGHGCMQIVDAVSGKPAFDLADAKAFPGLARSKDNRFFGDISGAAANSAGFLVVVGNTPAKEAEVFNTVRGHMLSECPVTGTLGAVAINPAGTVAACASLRNDTKGDVYLWSVLNGEPVAKPLPHPKQVYALAFSPNGKLLLTVSGGITLVRGGITCAGEIRLWDVQTGKQVGQVWDNAEPVEQLAFGPDGKEVLAVVQGNAITWQVETGKQRHTFAPPAPDTVKAAVWSYDGKWVLTGGGEPPTAKGRSGSLRIWDAATGQALCDPVAHPDNVLCLAAASDGRTVISGASDGKARLWQLEPAWKVLACATSPDTYITFAFDPPPDKEKKPLHGQVFRSSGEWFAAIRSGAAAKSEVHAEQAVAKLLKVERIDWQREMLLRIVMGPTPRGARYEIKIDSLQADAKTLTVTYHLVRTEEVEHSIAGWDSPQALVLVPRFAGQVVFAESAKK
jgi:RNA polymerase sigma factor (sigma-70 family)